MNDDQITPAEGTLAEWHRIVQHRDWDALPDLLAAEVTYHNPTQTDPLIGKAPLIGALRLLSGIFHDFSYTRHFSGIEGHALEFQARVGDAPFTGVDMLRFDDTGRIVDLTVMVRPVSAVMALGEEARRRMAGAGQGMDTH